MYKKAMRDANVTVHNKCYFVDDSAANVEAATKLGWTSVHVADDPKQSTAGDFQIHAVTELPLVLPDLWHRKQQAFSRLYCIYKINYTENKHNFAGDVWSIVNVASTTTFGVGKT